VPSPTDQTEVGRRIRAKDPDTPGSLGIAISEAIESAVADPDTRYSLGSVLNHVMLHQTVIGLEAQKQFEVVGAKPDVVIGCVGGGSNFAGLALPYVRDKIGGDRVRILAVEPASCPTLTRGPYAYDFGDTGQLTPLLAMHTLGHDFVPEPIHAGGLRYHGVAPILSQLVLDELVEATAIHQLDTFAAGLTFARTEGIIPAPETCHAVAAAITEAERAKQEGKERTIVFSFSGHGLLDLAAYDAYLSDQLSEHALPEEEVQRALKAIEALPKPRAA
jgi:tryptophan synthase beta chain